MTIFYGHIHLLSLFAHGESRFLRCLIHLSTCDVWITWRGFYSLAKNCMANSLCVCDWKHFCLSPTIPCNVVVSLSTFQGFFYLLYIPFFLEIVLWQCYRAWDLHCIYLCICLFIIIYKDVMEAIVLKRDSLLTLLFASSIVNSCEGLLDATILKKDYLNSCLLFLFQRYLCDHVWRLQFSK